MKKFFTISFILLLSFPFFAFAQSEVFKARVTEVIDEKIETAEDGQQIIQQKLRLTGLEGTKKDQEFIFDGIGNIQVIGKNAYKVGDKVLVSYGIGPDGEEIYFVVDYSRSTKLYLLAGTFALCVLTIGRFKGFASLITLALSFVVILKFIVPAILEGKNALLYSIIGGGIILLFASYITHGINKKSHLMNISIFISFALTAFLAVIATNAMHLTGFASEESVYLANLGDVIINMKGLLLSGIVIGVLGVLDDVVISQISIVEEIKRANSNLTPSQVFTSAFKVGVDHLSSVTNTLFFAYAGASLPLLVLFSTNQEPVLSFSNIISNEIVATEIVRMLVGSIGLIAAIPVSNFLASYFFHPSQEKKKHSDAVL